MFDSTKISYNPSTKIKINAVSGTLVKNYSNSFILHFNVNSKLGEKLLCDDPKLWRDCHCASEPVVILQMMLCGEHEVLAEVIFKDDFDEAQGKIPKGDV